MDEVKIGSKFTTMVVSKLIRLVLKSKFGYDIYIQLNEFNASVIDGRAHIHLSADAELDNSELTKILKTVGL